MLRLHVDLVLILFCWDCHVGVVLGLSCSVELRLHVDVVSRCCADIFVSMLC